MPVFKQWVLVKPKTSQGTPGGSRDLCEDDFELNEDHVPELRKGQILCRALFLSVDPITRLHMAFSMEDGDVFPGRQVARVVDSRHKEFPKGKLVCGAMGWQTYSVVSADASHDVCGKAFRIVEPLPRQLDSLSLPKSASLGVLGVPGLTAYIALVHACKAKSGETLVISSAAGQIGHLLGQIAKILGLNVVGYTGDPEKASWIKTDLGYDWAFNYKTQDLRQTLRISTASKESGREDLPHSGVDIFVDSVGGVFQTAVLDQMKFEGRICVLGTLAYYCNPSNIPMIPAQDLAISLKGLSIFGFNVFRYSDHFEESLNQLAEWCKHGQLKPYEHVVEGFENMPKAFMDMMDGKSQGKVIVRV